MWKTCLWHPQILSTPSVWDKVSSVYRIQPWHICKLLPLSCLRLSSSGGTFTSCNTRGRRVTTPEPRGRKSRPTKLSNTELFPLLWKETEHILDFTGKILALCLHVGLLHKCIMHYHKTEIRSFLTYQWRFPFQHEDSNSNQLDWWLTCEPTTMIWGSWMISAPSVRKTSCSLFMMGIRVSISTRERKIERKTAIHKRQMWLNK